MILHTHSTPTDSSHAMCGAALESMEPAFKTTELAHKAAADNDAIFVPCVFCLNAAQLS